MSAYISQNLTLTIYDCVDAGNCTTTVTTISNNEAVSSPPASHVVAIHQALLERERMTFDKRNIMIPRSNIIAEDVDVVFVEVVDAISHTTTAPSSVSIGHSKRKKKNDSKKQRLHFCHQPDVDKDNTKAYLQRYHCGFNRVNVCHFNGKEFTTMCVKVWSAIFRHLDPVDYCGECGNNGEEQNSRSSKAKVENHQRKVVISATH